MRHKLALFAEAHTHILETFEVTWFGAFMHALKFINLLESKCGNLSGFDAVSLCESIDNHVGRLLSWRDPARKADVEAKWTEDEAKWKAKEANRAAEIEAKWAAKEKAESERSLMKDR